MDGGPAGAAAATVRENLARFASGEPLSGVVDIARGY
jgi:hypothetical protein